MAPNCTAATTDGIYPMVFSNDLVDSSFGITAKIVLDELRLNGRRVHSLEVPNSGQHGVTSNRDQMVTSFPSKSEIGLNLSIDRHSVSFMGYLAPVDAIDVSNSNTPDVVDSTNPVTSALLARDRRRSTSVAVSASPRPTPIAATTAAPPF